MFHQSWEGSSVGVTFLSVSFKSREPALPVVGALKCLLTE